MKEKLPLLIIRFNYSIILWTFILIFSSQFGYSQNSNHVDSLINESRALADNGNYPDALSRANLAFKSATSPIQRANALHTIGYCYFRANDSAKALENYRAALKIRKIIKDSMGIAHSYNNICLLYANFENYDSAFEYGVKYLGVGLRIKDTTEIVRAYDNFGKIYRNIGLLDTSLRYYSSALALKESKGDSDQIAQSMNNIGNLYSDLKNFTKAKEYNFQALKLAKSLKVVAQCYNDIGSIYTHEHRQSADFIDSALWYYNRALSVRRQLDDSLEIAQTLDNIGLAYQLESKDSMALFYFRQALRIQSSRSFKIGVSTDLLHIGSAYINQNQFDSANKNIQKALSLAKANNYRSIMRDALFKLSALYEKFGKYEESLTYYKAAEVIEDSLNNIDIRENFLKQDISRRFIAKNDTLRRKLKLAEERAKQYKAEGQEWWRKALSTFVITLIAFVFLNIGFLLQAIRISWFRKNVFTNDFKDILGQLTLKGIMTRPLLKWITPIKLAMLSDYRKSFENIPYINKWISKEVVYNAPRIEGKNENDPVDDLWSRINTINTNSPRIWLIEGPSGIGKSALLEQMAIKALREKKTPILIKLNLFTEGGSSLSKLFYNLGQLAVDDETALGMVYNGGFYVFLDGLNECTEQVNVRNFVSSILRNNVVLLTSQSDPYWHDILVVKIKLELFGKEQPLLSSFVMRLQSKPHL